MKYLKTVISILLCISLTGSLFSCSTPADGPGSAARDVLDAYCVDYDEMVEIYNVLKKNGNDLRQIPYIDSKDSGINVRFTITMYKDWKETYDDEIDYFDRKLVGTTTIRCCIFLDEVPSEDHLYLEYEFDYDCLNVEFSTGQPVDNPAGAEDVDIYYAGKPAGGMQIYEVFYNGRVQFVLERFAGGRTPLSEEQLAQFEDKLALME